MLGLILARRTGVVLALAAAVMAASIAIIPTASAQDQSKDDSVTQVVSLLTADDLSYMIPVGTQNRRELLEVELSLLTDEHDLSMTADEQSAVIDAWLALIAHHQPRADYTFVPAGPGGASWSSGISWSSSGERPTTDTGYRSCSSRNIDAVGISFDVLDGYDTIHLDPSSSGTLFASVHDMYTDMLICLRRELHMNPQVRSWDDSIYDQLACHMAGWFLGAGATWDLEGYRGNIAWWPWGVWSHRCNW